MDHSVLLSKLKYYGVTGCSYELLSSYLTDKSQYVEFIGHKSDTLPISTGVPQDSVLGPLLFLIYINCLPLVSNIFGMLMYADDKTLYCNKIERVSEFNFLGLVLQSNLSWNKHINHISLKV